LFNADNEVRIIGTRHGEKLYETLLTREELAKAEDLGGYYRIIPMIVILTTEVFHRRAGADFIVGGLQFTQHTAAHRLGSQRETAFPPVYSS